MAHYIDEKDVYKLVEPRGTARVHCSQIDEIPRADVVPKSEVEEIIRENESLAKTVNEASELIRKLQSKVKKAKSDVAREIFEEIESKNMFLKDCVGNMGVVVLFKDISEIKKKYIEKEVNDYDTLSQNT